MLKDTNLESFEFSKERLEEIQLIESNYWDNAFAWWNKW